MAKHKILYDLPDSIRTEQSRQNQNTTEPSPDAAPESATGASWRTQDIAIHKVFPPLASMSQLPTFPPPSSLSHVCVAW